MSAYFNGGFDEDDGCPTCFRSLSSEESGHVSLESVKDDAVGRVFGGTCW